MHTEKKLGWFLVVALAAAGCAEQNEPVESKSAAVTATTATTTTTTTTPVPPTPPANCLATSPPPAGVAGSILFEKWLDVSGRNVADIPTGRDATATEERTSMEGPRDLRDNYGARLSGWLTPPETGAYTFWIAGDDTTALYLSTDTTRDHKARIAYADDFTGFQQWNKFATQKSAAVTLTKGQWYYIEALMKESSGSDHVSVGWLKPGQSGSQPSQVIPGSQLAPYREITTAPPIGNAGSILYERWLDVAGRTVADVPTSTAPNLSEDRPSFDGLRNIRDSYAVRMRGWVSPPATGAYTFFVSGDDNVALYLSTDRTEARKARIAYHDDRSGYQQWTRFATQKSAAVTLTKGQWYYIEALMKESSGEDHVTVGWLRPGQTGTPTGPIPGQYLAPFRLPGTQHPYIAQQSNGDVKLTVTLPSNQAYVEVFVQQNGVQNVAKNIVSSGVANAGGTTTYSYVAPASGFADGDQLITRFYSYKASSPGVFTPGPVEVAWSPIFVYRKLVKQVCVSKPDVCPGESVQVTVDASDGAFRAPTVRINGAPTNALWEQYDGSQGPRMVPVSVTSADGVVSSTLQTINLLNCGATPKPQRPPLLLGTPDRYQPDLVDFTIRNAGDYESGAPTYQWTFGDGTTATTTAGAVSHTFEWSNDLDTLYRGFDVQVTVKRGGQADVTGKRTFVVWNEYAVGKTRGALEPPVKPTSPVLGTSGGSYTAGILIRNLEPNQLVLDKVRVDEVPCNGDASVRLGTQTSINVSVPARGQITQPFSIAKSALHADACAVNVHYWGAVLGQKAQVSVPLDLPSRSGAGQHVNAAMNQVLQYVKQQGLAAGADLVSEEDLVRLYRNHQLPSTVVTHSAPPPPAPPTPPTPCDPDNPGTAPRSGFSCQPTGEWETASNGGPSGAQIANAMKGDAIADRSCSGFIGTLLAKVDPPQRYTHTGIMSKNRTEVTQSTGNDTWLSDHPNGVADQPTDGFDEHALRYLWPGTLTSTVEQTFGSGRSVATPEGKTMSVSGFGPTEVRCPGDANITFPRVIKPAPELDAMVRPMLNAAGDFSKTISAHYRFASYSKAIPSLAPDPSGPAPVPNGDGLGSTYGAVPTVCTQVVRLSLLGAGFTVDSDKTLPLPSDVRPDTPDGLFLYHAAERRAAGEALYAGLHDKVVMEIEGLESTLDDYWWVGPAVGLAFPPAMPLGTLGAFGLDSSGNILRWTTDAPDDVANQVTNCFASDFCSEDAKDSDDWKKTGDGTAVSADDIINHYDSPTTGGPYGYHERLVYRGKQFRALYAWLPSQGTRTLSGTVVDQAGMPVVGAAVQLPGQPDVLIPATDANGHFTVDGVIAGNLTVHAQVFIGDPATGFFREGSSCYVPHPQDPDHKWLAVECTDFTVSHDDTQLDEVTVALVGPDPRFRELVLDADISLEDCDCCGFDVCPSFTNPVLHVVCPVSYIEPTFSWEITPAQMCTDEVGLRIKGTCTLLPDQRTVRVEGKATLYEAGSGSCGGTDVGGEESFSTDIPAGATNMQVFVNDVVHEDVCIAPFPPLPFGCNDAARWNSNGIRAANRVAQ
jgi:hypothetical protein